jgi:hypothetical protein
MIKPTNPIAPMPRKHIFIDSQSSLAPGFTASFSVFALRDRNDLTLMVRRTLNISI